MPEKQVSLWFTGPCSHVQEETLRYPCADQDLSSLATSWRPFEENQWIDSRAGGQWEEDNRLVRQLMPSHPCSAAGPLRTDQVGKMPYKTLSELGLRWNSELWAPVTSSGTRGQTGVLSPAFSRGRIPGTKRTELAHQWSYRLNLDGLQESTSIALCNTKPRQPSHKRQSPSCVTCPEHTGACFTAADREKNREDHRCFPLDPTSFPSRKHLPPQRPVRSQVSH